MSHIPSQLPLSESAALDTAISANAAQDESPAFATPPDTTGLHEKDRLMRIGKEELEKRLKAEVESVKIAATAKRAVLKERIKRLNEVQQAEITVREMHMERGIQKLREEIYGERTVHVPGPIRKLPGELLSTIFQYHVEDDLSPWILAKVCKTWMQMAMRTPQLWCHLSILEDKIESSNSKIQSYVVNGRKELSIGRKQICSNHFQLQAALDRSGAALPLSVKITEYANWSPNGMVLSIFLRFISYPLSERLGNLHIGNMDHRFLESATPITVGKFPLLRSMRLPYSDALCIEKILESVSVTSQALETAFFRSGIHTMLAAYSFWSRLKCITMGTAGTRALGLNQVIDQLGGLESLEGPVYAWPNSQTPRAVLGNIREITLYCFAPHLGRLRLPQLETLKFMENGNRDSLNRYEQVSFPTVVNLEVSTNDEKWHLYTAGAFPAVKNFTLAWYGDDATPINTLEAMPSVCNVTLRGPNSSTFGILLFKALRLSDEPVLCPNLEKLSLGNGVDTTRPRLTPWVKKAIKFRKDIGRPVQEITVYWPNKEVTVFPGM